MMWQTHAVVGANTVWILIGTGMVTSEPGLLIAAAAGAALLPDIEARNARIQHTKFAGAKPFLVIGHSLNAIFGHRKFIHSIPAMALVGLISFVAFRNFTPDIPLAITLGYTSHCIIDGFNRGGVQYFWPWKKKLNLLPKFLRFKVRSTGDFLLFFLGVVGLLGLLLSTVPETRQIIEPFL